MKEDSFSAWTRVLGNPSSKAPNNYFKIAKLFLRDLFYPIFEKYKIAVSKIWILIRFKKVDFIFANSFILNKAKSIQSKKTKNSSQTKGNVLD